MGGATGRAPSCPPRLNPVCHLTAAETEAERQSSPGTPGVRGREGHPCGWQLLCPPSPGGAAVLSLQATFCPRQLPHPPAQGGGSIVPAGCFLPMASGLTSAESGPVDPEWPSLPGRGPGLRHPVGWGPAWLSRTPGSGFQGQSWGLQGQAACPADPVLGPLRSKLHPGVPSPLLFSVTVIGPER